MLSIPATGVDLERFAVVACDQHTSNPAYWEAVDRHVGENPSTLRLTLPEVHLHDEDWESRIEKIHQAMVEYLANGVLVEHPSTAVRIRRRLHNGDLRTGFLFAVDLEQYDYVPDVPARIKASEQTIAERLPARMRARQGAALETSHVLVLYEDPGMLLAAALEDYDLTELYTTPLMFDGGSICADALPVDHPAMGAFLDALESLDSSNTRPFFFATGDGNHSLAAAKEVWKTRRAAGAADDDPYRYALVELVNVYDPGLHFHPIHRLVMHPRADMVLDALLQTTDARYMGLDEATVMDYLTSEHLGPNEVAFVSPHQCGILKLAFAPNGPFGTAVEAVDAALSVLEHARIDYVHGDEEVVRLADQNQAAAVVLPAFDRAAVFATVESTGVLPRKAFSLGEANDKRYYLECRRLQYTAV